MSTRQVTAYIGECIGAHLAPDALGIKRISDHTLRLVVRKPATADEPGDVFLIHVQREPSSRAPARGRESDCYDGWRATDR